MGILVVILMLIILLDACHVLCTTLNGLCVYNFYLVPTKKQEVDTIIITTLLIY